MSAPGEPPGISGWLPRVLRLALAGLLLGGALLTLLLAAGMADPPLAGPLAWVQESAPGACIAVQGLALPPLMPPVTLELTVHVTTPPAALTGWGVWLGAPDGALRWDVLPPGYYRHAGQTVDFPHVGSGPNTLRLDVRPEGYTLWLNRERALDGPLAGSAPAVWGMAGAPPAVCWERIALYRQN